MTDTQTPKTIEQRVMDIVLLAEYAANLDCVQGRNAFDTLADIEIAVLDLRKAHPALVPPNPAADDMKSDR